MFIYLPLEGLTIILACILILYFKISSNKVAISKVVRPIPKELRVLVLIKLLIFSFFYISSGFALLLYKINLI
jgi:hypothetical protein